MWVRNQYGGNYLAKNVCRICLDRLVWRFETSERPPFDSCIAVLIGIKSLVQNMNDARKKNSSIDCNN